MRSLASSVTFLGPAELAFSGPDVHAGAIGTAINNINPTASRFLAVETALFNIYPNR
jgi:hypothetical protein